MKRHLTATQWRQEAILEIITNSKIKYKSNEIRIIRKQEIKNQGPNHKNRLVKNIQSY